ncbi:MAG: hypothetical protein M3N05_07510 [Pseudomonadota bacterium]|nr:hypothetical protein [Pseudomonadota bacterium]
MPQTFLGQLSYIVFLAMCALALWRGLMPERASAIFLALVCVATPFIQDHTHYDDPNNRLFFMNAPPVIWTMAFALIFGKPWMMSAAAFELLCAVSEAAHDLGRRLVGAYVYLSLSITFSWGAYLSLGYGGLTARGAWRRRSGSLEA